MSTAAPGPACSRVALRAGQRARILDAVVEVVAERGLAGASIAAVLAHAKVSRGAFYELFGSLDEALIAVIDETFELVSRLITQELQQGLAWRDGLRSVLAEVLRFLDSRPALARVCIVEVLGAGPVVLARRERNMGVLRCLIAEHLDLEPRASPTLAVEGLMAAVAGIVHARLVMREPEPLIGLLGPLMALIVGGLTGARAAASEIEQGDRLAQAMLAEPGICRGRRPTSPYLTWASRPCYAIPSPTVCDFAFCMWQRSREPATGRSPRGSVSHIRVRPPRCSNVLPCAAGL